MDEQLLGQWGKLDQVYIEDWLSQFSAALESTELLSRYLVLRKNIQRLVG